MTDPRFVDTNLLVYAVEKHIDKAVIVEAIILSRPVLSTQVLGEFANVCRKRLKMPPEDIIGQLKLLTKACRVAVVDTSTLIAAIKLQQQFPDGLSHWDSLIVAVDLQSECKTLLTEDQQLLKLVIPGLTIQNPFVRA